MIVNGEGRIVVDYMAELFDEPTIARIMASYASLLSSMAAAPEAPVAAADLFPSGGLHSLLTEFAPGEARPDHLAAPLVHVAFEQHAAAEPTRPCLVFEGTTLSYGEANERANILAHALAAAGAVKGTPIGLMLDRSPDLLVAMLAAWKVRHRNDWNTDCLLCRSPRLSVYLCWSVCALRLPVWLCVSCCWVP